MTEAVDALELFKSEIRSLDLPVRLECIAHMDVIAYAMGAKEAETTLIPLITECVKGVFCPDDDEMLLAFAKNLPRMLPFLPEESGPASLVPILELLASQDETVIRDAAVASLGQIALINASVCSESCFPALLRLFKAEWFSSKLAACGFAPYVYKLASEESRAQIRALFLACANDETPMVKRAAAVNLSRMIDVVEKSFVIKEFLPVFKQLARDDTQDAVRSSCVAASLSLCKLFSEQEAQEHVRDTVASLATDKSWRVRLAVVKVYGNLCACMGKESTISHLVEPLVGLMKDQEPDVRKAAIVAFQSVASLLSPSLVASYFVPLFAIVSKDPVQQVRSALSECIAPLARSLGKEFTLTHLLPLLLESVKDDFCTIRYNATSAIATVCEVVKENEAVVAQLVALLHTLSQDANWRTRLAVLEQIPPLCNLLGKETYETKLESLFLSFFGDSVAAVRDALSVEIGKLVVMLGEEWTVNHFVAKVLTLYSDTNAYSSRVAILQTLPRMASVMTKDEDIARLLLPIVNQACKDAVPNVRFIACSVAEKLVNHKADMRDTIKANVEPLLSDPDVDVRFFAIKALA